MKEFSLPVLPYGYADLEPHIDTRKMELHHLTHHKTYTNKFNAVVSFIPEGTKLNKLFSECLVKRKTEFGLDENVWPVAIEHGGGYFNHCLYFATIWKEI